MATIKLDIPLRTVTARVIFVAAFCLGLALFSYRVSQIAWAAEQLESTDPDEIGTALVIDGQNPALHNRAGIIYINGDQPQPERALQEFRGAVNLNPSVSDYWENLGRTCFFVNDLNCAEDAYLRAVAAAPQRLSILNELGMYYVSTGNPEKALPHFHRELEFDPASANSMLNVCLRSLSPESVWMKLIADQKDVSVKFEFFSILREQKMDQAAQSLWDRFMSSRPSISFDDTKPYLGLLERQHNYAELSRAWQDLERLPVSDMPLRAANNRVVNAGFEQPPTSVGLDWHISSEEFLDTQVVASDHGNALQFDFTVASNSDHESAYQLLPVEPGGQYELRARVRSQDITSDSGPRLRVVDPICEDCLNVSSGGTTGTTEWHDVATSFAVGPATRMVRLSVWRPRSRYFPTEIHGRFWVDDVSIRVIR